MTKDTIVQYVCFITNLSLDEFLPEWERYARRMKAENCAVALYRQVPDTKSRFLYFSRHEWADSDSNQNFFESRKSEHFPEHIVKVVQAGGYLRLPPIKRKQPAAGDITLVAFVGHNDPDIEFYQELHHIRSLLFTRLILKVVHMAIYWNSTFPSVKPMTWSPN